MNSIKTVSFGNFLVSFRDDAFLNATAIAKQYGKRVGDYLRNDRTQEYIEALAENLSRTRKITLNKKQLVAVKNGGTNNGTWLHPKLAIDFARWLDPKFAVWCDEQIEQLLSGSQPKPAKTTVADRTPLRQAVSALVGKCNIDYSSAYNMVHQRFGVESIEEIAADKLPDAVAYVHALTLHSGLFGEVLDKQPALPEGAKVLTAQDLHNLKALLAHFPYMFAYFHRTFDAVGRLNREIVYRTHDRFGDGAIFARQLAQSFSIPMKSWRDVEHELA